MKKKILIFIDWYLPGYKAGGPIQSVANMVEHLKDDFEFSIVTRNTDYCETQPYPGIKSNEWNSIANGNRVFYFSADQLNRRNIRNLIRKENFDCVYLNGIYSVYFTLYPLIFLRKKCDKRVIIAARGMLSKGSLDVKSTKKQFFLRSVKVLGLFDEVVFHATTRSEKKDIEYTFGDKISIKTAANLPQKIPGISWQQKEKNAGILHLVNIARISPEKNLLFALHILKEVKSNVQFDIYGPVYDQEYWSECLEVLKQMPANVTVRYKGSLEPQKVLSELQKHHFLFMPSTGENFGHIILQSFTAGTPVIISDQTPWKDLKNKNIGWDGSLQHPESFINIIDEASDMSETEYLQLSKNAFEFARTYYENSEIIEQNKHLFL